MSFQTLKKMSAKDIKRQDHIWGEWHGYGHIMVGTDSISWSFVRKYLSFESMIQTDAKS